MSSDVANNLDMFSMLGFIKQYACGLSERHNHQQFTHPDHGSIIESLVTSAFRDLSECIDIINARAPVSKLTEDTLRVVFQKAHEQYLARYDPPGIWLRPVVPTQLCLSQVSRTWRRLTRNLPTLWTTVKVSTPWSLRPIETCLSASGSLPIDLYIKGFTWRGIYHQTHVHTEHEIKSLCTAISPHIRRCRSICITTDDEFWPLVDEVVNQFSDMDAPLLETLSIVGPHLDKGPRSVCLFRQGSPRLTTARFTVDVLTACHPCFRTITTLTLGGRDDFEFTATYSVLSECLSLETLIIHGNVVPRWTSRPRGIILFHLRSVQLHGCALPTTEFLWDLAAPSLTELTIIPHTILGWLPFFGEENRSQFHTVKKLTISPHLSDNTTLGMTRQILDDASSRFPQIESLTLVGPRTHQALQGLTEVKDARAWPDLRDLTLPEILDKNDESALCDFVTRRGRAGAPLPRILLGRISSERMTRLDWLGARVDVAENATPVRVDGFLGIKDSGGSYTYYSAGFGDEKR